MHASLHRKADSRSFDRRPPWIMALVVAASMLAGGCRRIVEVTGTVRVDGKPAKGVVVMFDSSSANDPRGVATTDENGGYRLRRLGPGSKPGVLTGMYVVKVMSDMDNPSAGKIPVKYLRESPLTREVKGPSPHTYDIEISTK